ncbi:MAG: hypothetical protein WCL26_03660 [Actinomycetes bacterium]
MNKNLLLMSLIIVSGLLLRRSVKSEKKRRYDRKPQTPWSALNEDKDPTL